MELNIYSPEFEYLGVIDSFTSLRWRRQLFGGGEVELHAPVSDYVLALTLPELFIHREGYNELAVLEGRKISDTEENGESIAATGQLGNIILGRAILDHTFDFEDTPVELAMRQLVSELMPPVYGRIDLGDLRGFTETITAQISYRNLLDVLVAMAKSSGIFFRLRPDIPGRRFIFETFKGADRSVGQTENPRVVFSDLDHSLGNPVYEENIKNWKNYAVVAGEGEGDARVKVTIDRVPAGGYRRALFVDGKSVRKGDLSTTKYKAQLTQYGNEKLDAAGPVQNFESDVDHVSTYRYREEWDLADVVTAHKSAWDIIQDERVTEVEEVYEESTGAAGVVTPVLGSPLPEKFTLGGA